MALKKMRIAKIKIQRVYEKSPLYNDVAMKTCQRDIVLQSLYSVNQICSDFLNGRLHKRELGPKSTNCV